MVAQSRRRASVLPVSVDRRWDWLLGQVAHSFPKVTAQNVRSFGNSEGALQRVNAFLDGGEGDPSALYFFSDKGNSGLRVELKPPDNAKGVCVYAVKLEARTVSSDAFDQEIVVGDLPAVGALPHMCRVTQSVYAALLRAHVEEQGWGDVVSNQVMEAFGTLVSNVQVALGQVRGVTCLPLPPDPRPYADSNSSSGGEDRQQQENAPPEGQTAPSHGVPSAYAENDGGKRFKPASSFGQPSSGCANKASVGVASSDGGPYERSGGMQGPEAAAEADNKELMHVLESTLITWTKQIKNEPEASLPTSSTAASEGKKQQRQQQRQPSHHPGPLEELEFWEQKAADLNGMFSQLQSSRVRKILRYLDRSKSTYSTPFAKLCKEAFLARSEANDTIKYLRPLRPWLQRIDAEISLENLPALFRPALHVLLLVWKSSGYYNTSTRLVVFVREMCNTLIERATSMLAGGEIFRLIEQEQQKEAVRLLETSLRVLGSFKTAYFDYKGKAAVECPSNPWRAQNNAMFSRIDAFLERCHDVLDLTTTIAQFQKLANLEVGGTKGKVLTTSVAQIYVDFGHAVDAVKNVDYDVMDLDAAEAFEDSYQTFRLSVKSLERRLASVLTQAFDDCPTLRGRFRLLDCFSDLVHRPAIAEELQRKHSLMVQDFAAEVALVMQVLATEEARELVKAYALLVGQLADFENEHIEAWGASILTSIEAKLKNPLLVREADRLLRTNFDPLIVRLLREVKYFLLLGLRVPESALEVFERGELFRRHMGNLDLIVHMHNSVETTLLPVERPLLQQHLDRIDLLLSQGIGGERPKSPGPVSSKPSPGAKGGTSGGASGISSGAAGKGSKKKAGQNPSGSKKVPGMGANAPGAGAGGGYSGGGPAQTLNWRSTGIDVFIGEAMTEVKELSETLAGMKGNLKRLEAMTRAWATQPLFERGAKTSTAENFQQMQSVIITQRRVTGTSVLIPTLETSLFQEAWCAAIREGGQELHKLLKDTNRKLKVSAGLPDWKNYVDFVNSLVVQGLIKVVAVSLSTLNQQMSQAYIAKQQLPPMLELEMHLSDGKVTYIPDIGGVESRVNPEQVSANAAQKGVGGGGSSRVAGAGGGGKWAASLGSRATLRRMTWGWVEGFLSVAKAFRRIDATEGTYLKDIQDDPEVRLQVSQIHEKLDAMETAMLSYKNQFSAYEYLWTTDLQAMFRVFLEEASYDEAMEEDDEEPAAGGGGGGGSNKAGGGAEQGGGGGAGDGPDDRVVRMLDLAKFDEKIHLYLGVQSEVTSLRHTQDVGFVRVNAQPMKQAISTWVTKWIYVFAQSLQDHVSTSLERMYSFISYTQKGLETPLSAEDKDGIMSTMTHIRDVRKKAPMVTGLFGPLKDTVMLLKSRGIPMDLPPVNNQPALEFLDSAYMLWDNTVNKAYRVKGEIQPLQNAAADGVRKDIANFGEEVKAFVSLFQRTAPFAAPLRQRGSLAVDGGAGGGGCIENGSAETSDPAAIVAASYKKLDRVQLSLKALEAKAASMRELEELFELSPTRHTGLVEVRTQLRLLKMVWDTAGLVDGLFASWTATLWADIQTDELLDEARSLQLHIRGLPRRIRDWGLYKAVDERVVNMSTVLPLIHELHSPAMRDRHWKDLLDVTEQHRPPAERRMSRQARRRSSLIRLGGEGGSPDGKVAPEPRITLATVLGPTFSLEDALSLDLHRHVEACMEAVEVATKELKVETRLRNIEDRWEEEQLGFVRHRDTEVFVLFGADEVLEALEDHQMQLQGMAGMGKFVDFFRQEVTEWQATLGEVETFLKLMLTVQRQWTSLEAIFLTSKDIRSQLPDDTRRFEGIDLEFKDLMKSASYCPNVVVFCSEDGRAEGLINMHRELEKCERALTEYLDMKKNVFPRFYFVSNAALLDILSNGNDPPKIQPHLGSVFDGIGALEFSASDESADPSIGTAAEGGGADRGAVDDPSLAEESRKSAGVPETAVAMLAKDGERVPFHRLFHMAGAVETWLTRLVTWMQKTLMLRLDEAVREAALWEVDKPREEWLFGFPAELALLAGQIIWTEECERSLEEYENGAEDAVRKYLEVCCVRLDGLIRLVQGELTKESRAKIITLITIDVHSRDVVQGLIDRRVESNLDFAWQSQLRYYWTPQDRVSKPLTEPSGGAAGAAADAVATTSDGCVRIKICDFRSVYSFEFAGNCGRLVITPLTDRCYVTLTTALRLMLGGAPAGPAGTGKTETTKDLARGLGLPCYVFNCSDQMNYRTMGDIFKGLTQVGAWGCFDEFNRISIEVLSVVASQVKCIQDAVVRFSNPDLREPQYQHLPAGIPNVKVGVFDFLGEAVSMVPTCGFFITMNPGYAGRTELPENLKALFRSCAMIRPDLRPICENMLMAEGFVKARALAVKFVTLYSLSSELLSKQFHYDWGLRAVKSVLLVAGKLKRCDPHIDEEAVLMRALRDFNTPKIVSADTPIFLRLISDLFPSTDLAPKVNEVLSKTCAQVCVEELSLQANDDFIVKVVQFQELLDVRHSVMVLGPAGCGKTTVWKTLMACHNRGKAKPSTIAETVNPKAVTSDELYGYMTLAKEWKDGVLSIIMRNMSKEWAPFGPHQDMKWVILDGDIDAVWIESMNTVMDDNKVLTLVSNERIPLTAAMRMIFEIHSLKNATPATVSRAGILFVNETDIGWHPYAESWVQARTLESEKVVLEGLFNRYVPDILEMLKKGKMEPVVPIPTISMVQAVCRLLEGLLPALTDKTTENMERVFLFAAMWAFGGALSSDAKCDDRRSFSQEWRKLLPSKTVKLPDQGLVFDYFINPENGEVVRWADKVPSFTPSIGQSFASMLVPTTDLVRLTFLTELLVGMKRHVMLVGSVGTGKTSLVQGFLRDNASDTQLSCTINTSYYTDAAAMQRQLEQPLDKRSGKTYGPPSSKRLIFFVDDLNMPFIEEYGTQTPIALLRQYMDYRGWYDRSDLGLRKNIVDVQFLGAMNHKSGSFSVNPRLQRHFVTLGCQTPGDDDLSTIYGAVIGGHLSTFPSDLRRFGGPVLEATIALHRAVCAKFLPTAVKFYYGFNLRDLSCLVQRSWGQGGRDGVTDCDTGALRKEVGLTAEGFVRGSLYSRRLVSDSEVKAFDDMMQEAAKKHLGLDQAQQEVLEDTNVFTSFAVPPEDENLPFSYLPVPSMDILRHELQDRIKEYNETHAIMNLVLFDQAMHHVSRISRILQFPRGNALLLGVGGSGKQTLCKLAAFISGCEVSEIAVTSNYGVADLRAELKDLYRKAGVKPALPLVFMLTDSQIVDERFLVYVNDLLTSGVIPDLFTKEEFDAIFQAIRIAAKSAGVPDVRDSLMQFFVDRRFPGLINCTQIDLFRPWPRDALVKVSLWFLEDMALGDDEIKENIAHHMAEVHDSVREVSQRFLEDEGRYNYTTPKSFLELIDFYKELLRKKRGELDGNISRLANGLQTLRKTNNDVQTLRDDLKVKMKEVEAKKLGTEVLLEEMGVQRSEAEAQQAIADVEKSKADLAANNARNIEVEAEMELAVAKPALMAAHEAVNCLDKASLTELKSFSKPPPGVDLVTTALLIMVKLERKNFSWENAKKMMAKVDAFKEQLEEYRGEDVPEEVVKRVQPLLLEPDFTYAVMKTKSAAAANLCNWVINIINFNQIYKKVKPLMDALEAAQEAKAVAIADLAKVEDALAVINAHLGKLEKSFMEATEEKTRVEGQASACKERLGLAERLTNGLASENERWGEEVERLQTRGSSIVGDVLLAAAFVSYAGAFSKDYRQELWRNRWLPDLTAKMIPLREELDPLQMLTSASQVAEWQNERLPSDQISVENGGIITQCQRWPLIIDPQLQGIRWLRRHEEVATEASGRSLHVLQMGEANWMKKVVAAIQQGDTVIVENCPEDIDASLNPVLQRAVIRRGSNLFLRLGGEDCEYDPAFRLYLQSRLSNPHYRPEVFATCTLINFIVTERGLEDQLLASVVGAEQPELEKTKNDLVQASNRYKMQLEGLEDQLLQRLADAPADILADVDLIEAREVYRPVAAEASLMYFMLLKLSTVDSMYQYSLDSFTRFFFKAIFSSKPALDDQPQRVENLRRSLRFTVYSWVTRGLFETHRLIFLTQVTFGLLQASGMTGSAVPPCPPEQAGHQVGAFGGDTAYSAEALNFLLKGGRNALAGGGGDDPPPADWLSESAWRMVLELSSLDGFAKLANDVAESAPRFREWFDAASPELEKLPLDWRELDKRPFLKLLVVKCLRPDRITQAIANFVRNNLPDGPAFADIDAKLNSFQVLSEAFKDSDPATPIYFILSAGANVTADVDKLADKHGMERGSNYHDISLGQGHWVVLNNVHLMPRWLPTLDKRLDYFKEVGCIKLTNDPPSGLRANLKQAFASISREEYSDLEPRTQGILFGLCHFHALMLERKKFGPKGFNMMYPFSSSDLTCSVAVLKNYMENAPSKVPWADLRYLFGEIMYGGHIVNDFDRLMCSTYLTFFMRDELLDEMPLYPYPDSLPQGANGDPSAEIFMAPSILDHIDATLRGNSPVAFGLHPNAEIGFRTETSDQLLAAILALSAGDRIMGRGAVNGGVNFAEQTSQDILEVVRDAKFDLEAIAVACDNDLGPYENILLQECERMNLLVGEIVRTLSDLCLAFKGDLTMTEQLEELQLAVSTDKVPHAWEKLAYPSMRSLPLWLSNLQVTAKAGGLELDKLSVSTEVTKKMDVADIAVPSRDGAYINGLSLDGARWNLQAQHLESSKPREMYCPMPVITCVAVINTRADNNTFMCPVYKTQMRGPTYVFDAFLRTKAPAAKWVLAGVVLVMDIV
eukprot:g10196.t1